LFQNRFDIYAVHGHIIRNKETREVLALRRYRERYNARRGRVTLGLLQR